MTTDARADAPARTAGRRPLLRLLGPAFVAAIAYVDPGNVAANLTAGAGYGYLLLWVLVVANAMAVLVQYLSAKLGIVTGKSLPETLGTRIRRPWARRAYWVQAELVAMATDIAEVIGGAVALNLLFGIPLVWGGVITGAVSIVLLMLQSRRGPRTFEFVVIGLVAIIAIGFTFGVFIAPPEAGSVVTGLVPRFEDTGSVLLAASILGATIMPHAIYAHSALARDRFASGANLRVVARDPADVFSEAEMARIAAFNAAMGLDWGTLDILRDVDDGRIYIVDVNKTDVGPVLQLSMRDKLRSTRTIARALRALIATA